MSHYPLVNSSPSTEKLIPVSVIIILFALIGCSQKSGKYKQGVKPEVTISSTNTSTVKKYEKFEANLVLKNAEIENPYDPADIDVYALFSSPSGSEIKINGFYDNYEGADKWKVRFSPVETGEYKFQVFVKDGTETGQSQAASFTAIESDHHGWIKPSGKNPHYFSYDDGTSYYAVGAYSPWGNSAKTF